ncbi:MAG: DnaJ domain-containing protein, partial [Anaerolineae bacterium]|nr:DnaJ domain-containing protein [Anaerolineae bacterium]
MQPLLALYGDRLYGYEVHGRQIYVFPVYFDGTSSLRRTRYGPHLDVNRLVCRTETLQRAELNGVYQVADFGDPHAPPPPRPHPLAAEYARLGITTDADLKTIKHAYRRLARRYHPDINRDPGAHLYMQQI